MDFIPANESPLFIKGFRLYTRLLFKRKFARVWLKQDYQPDETAKTIYYLNHHSWWDGLIPFLLNEYCFHQQARALMEDKQMRQYPFFSRIGAFSINREDKKAAIRSLRYAVTSLERPNACLFIYPEGKITPPGAPLHFEGGLTWLTRQLPDVDVVPIGIYMHTMRHAKPELHLQVGSPVKRESQWSRKEQTRHFEHMLDAIRSELHQQAGMDDTVFRPFV